MASKIVVIVPTYKEDANVDKLTRRLFAATRKAGLSDVKLLLVDDDSGEPTKATLAHADALKKEGFDIRVRVRRAPEGRGLSSAVLVGLAESTEADYFVVMDADLQHEPETVPALLAPVMTGQADFSVGSRNVSGGVVADDWPLIRRVISAGATLLARPLTTCTDPMSGFFALPRSTYERGKKLNPLGYKIGLELQVRCRCRNIVDVPIRFMDREAGESKLSMKQNLLYLMHLVRLYWFKFPLAFVLVVLLLLLLILAFLFVLVQLFQRYQSGEALF